ncbi:MAG: DUF3073 domain-containing protein [Motilibacteraceae bacterium]
MGRGRAKAKQTKVARELKYHTPSTDLTALQRELAGTPTTSPKVVEDEPDDEYDPYSDEYEDEDDGPWASSR